MKHKLMQAMAERETGRRLGGPVQVDDVHLDGERNGGKAGRGSENKRPFVIGVSTSHAGHPRSGVITPVPGFTKAALTDWAERHLQPETDVYSDGLSGFRPVVDLGPAHTASSTWSLSCPSPTRRNSMRDSSRRTWTDTSPTPAPPPASKLDDAFDLVLDNTIV